LCDRERIGNTAEVDQHAVVVTAARFELAGSSISNHRHTNPMSGQEAAEPLRSRIASVDQQHGYRVKVHVGSPQ
jgi:hypothetical protein